MDESQAEFYLNRLKNEKNPTQALVAMCKSILGFDAEYPRIGRLIKIYGGKLIYFSILDCADLGDGLDTTNNVYGLIAHFAKKRLQIQFDNIRCITDLTPIAEKNSKRINRKNKLKIPEVIEA